jgi:cytochrome P450
MDKEGVLINIILKSETPDFDSSERDASLSGAQSFHVTKRIPWLNDIMMALPEYLVGRLSPALGSFMRQKRTTRARVAGLASASKEESSHGSFVPILSAVMESPKLPPNERSVDRVAQDAQMLLMAGTLTQASVLEHLMYWMISSPEVLRKLKEELLSVMPSIKDVGKVPLTKLESLPYLTAIIKESIRLIYGNSTPHFRWDPDRPLIYEDKLTGKSWEIPPKTSVGMSSVLLHHNEHHFPNSEKFIPERWLGDEGKKLDKYNVGFGRGSRICIGMNQAYGVMRLVLAQIWRLWASPEVSSGDEVGVLSLYKTTPHDVQMSGDFFVAAYNKPQGVEFKVTSR